MPDPTLADFDLDPATVSYYQQRGWSWVERARHAHPASFRMLWACGTALTYAGLIARTFFAGPAPDPAQRGALLLWGCGLVYPLASGLAGYLVAGGLMLGLSLAAPLIEGVQFAAVSRSRAFKEASERYQAYLDACERASGSNASSVRAPWA